MKETGKEKKYLVFRSEDDGEVYAIRMEKPRFTVKYIVNNEISNIEFFDIKDEISPMEAAKLMRGVGEAIARFLRTEEYERSKK